MPAKKAKKSKNINSVLVTSVLLIFFAAVSFNFVSQMKAFGKLKDEETLLLSQIETEKEKKSNLLMQEAYNTSDSYIEKIAREQLGLIKPNEILFVYTDE